jgi:hypothetical protein
MATAANTYHPARSQNPAAAHRAAWYVSLYGSAAAALREVENPGYDDAFDRAVNEELRQMRFVEQTAALARKAAA